MADNNKKLPKLALKVLLLFFFFWFFSYVFPIIQPLNTRIWSQQTEKEKGKRRWKISLFKTVNTRKFYSNIVNHCQCRRLRGRCQHRRHCRYSRNRCICLLQKLTQMNEWKKERMTEWMNEWINGWINEWMKKGREKEKKSEQIFVQLSKTVK